MLRKNSSICFKTSRYRRIMMASRLSLTTMLTKTEVHKLVRQPISWVLLALCFIFFSLLFYRLCVDHINLTRQALDNITLRPSLALDLIKPFCSWTCIVLALVIPVLTSQSLSQEFRQKTIYLITLSPIKPCQWVIAKYFSLLIFLGIIIFFEIILLSALGLEATLDLPRVSTNLLAILLVGASWISLGLLIAALLEQAFLAIGFGVLSNLLLLLLEWLDPFPGQTHVLAKTLSMLAHCDYLLSGVLYSPDLAYYGLVNLLCLGTTIIVVGYKTKRSRASLCLIRFVVLALTTSLLYWATVTHPWQKDLSTPLALSPTTQSLLQAFKAPIRMTLYSEAGKHYSIRPLMQSYQQAAGAEGLKFEWQKPDPHHSHQDAFVIQYQDQQTVLDLKHAVINENSVTQALFALQRKSNHWIVFLQGHGEPAPFGEKGGDFRLWTRALENQGLKMQRLDLRKTSCIPENTQLLVIASSPSAWLPQEESQIADYIRSGKDLLWLIDPKNPPQPVLSELLGIFPLPGTVVDLHGQRLGTPHPAITLIEQFEALPFDAPRSLSALPFACALKIQANNVFASQFTVNPLLKSDPLSWTETGSLSGPIAFDPEQQEVAGPLLLAVSLTRRLGEAQTQEQRIAVIGNSRFLGNGAIENYGNLAFGLNLVNWLGHDDQLISLKQPVDQDQLLQVHRPLAYFLKWGAPLIGVGLGGFALIHFWRRRAIYAPREMTDTYFFTQEKYYGSDI